MRAVGVIDSRASFCLALMMAHRDDALRANLLRGENSEKSYSTVAYNHNGRSLLHIGRIAANQPVPITCEKNSCCPSSWIPWEPPT